MGFFSWNCAKSNKPVMSTYAVQNTPWKFASRVRVLFKDGAMVVGDYDGYGRVHGLDLMEYHERDWRMVIERYYNGETFDELSPNKHDQGQGFFYDDNDLKQIFG